MEFCHLTVFNSPYLKKFGSFPPFRTLDSGNTRTLKRELALYLGENHISLRLKPNGRITIITDSEQLKKYEDELMDNITKCSAVAIHTIKKGKHQVDYH